MASILFTTNQTHAIVTIDKRKAIEMIKTSHWSAKLPHDHMRIGISRGTPRGASAGYRTYRKLAPGQWFHSAEPAEYLELYNREILAPLDPRVVAEELYTLAQGRIPVMLCFERAGKPGDWCHRAMAAQWLAEGIGQPVPEFDHEQLCQHMHPLWPDAVRPTETRGPAGAQGPDLRLFLGKTAMIDGQMHKVIAIDADDPSKAVVQAGMSTYKAGVQNLQRFFK
jgi:hypothetical protein